MFDKAKQLMQLQKLQSEIKKKLESLTSYEEKGLNSVVVTGDKKIQKIVINGVEDKVLRDLINTAMKKMDTKIEKEMKEKEEELKKLYGF
jgi:DNA-binding protein YbaB